MCDKYRKNVLLLISDSYLSTLLESNYNNAAMQHILKYFENISPRLYPFFHNPLECQRDNCYCISKSDQLVVCPRNFMVVNLL